MVVSISEFGSLELHTKYWINEQDDLVFVASLYPTDGHYIPAELSININLLFLPTFDHPHINDLAELSKPTGLF